MRSKVGAVLTALGLALGGLAMTAAPAHADTQCTVENFSPRSVTVGLSPVKARFGVSASDCTLDDWDVQTNEWLVWAWKSSPYETFNPWYLDNSEAGRHDMQVTATNDDYDDTVRIMRDSFSLKRRTYWQTGSFNASPEPVRKGKPITIKGRLKVADWDNDRYVGYGGRTINIQFRTSTGQYATVKTVKTRSDGWVNTTVTASKSGYWRATYAGSSAAGSSQTTGDYVQVK